MTQQTRTRDAAGPLVQVPTAPLRADVAAVVVLLALGLCLPLALGAFAGSVMLPRIDDWAYRDIALELAESGNLVLNVRTMIVGLVLVTQPFLWLSGLDPWAFTAVGVVAAAASVLTAYALARRFLPPLRATLAVSLMVLFPGYLAYATSYLSDVPALAPQFICLVLGAIALNRRPVGTWPLLGAAIAGSFAFSVRDFAVAAPAAVLFAALVAEPRRIGHWVLAAGVAGCYGLLYLLRAALFPADMAVEISSGGSFQALQAFAILSLVVAPAAVVGAFRWRGHLRRFDVLVGAEIGLVIAGIRILQWVREGTPTEHVAILPTMTSQWGLPQREMFLGDRPPLMADVPWVGLNILALAAGVLVLGLVTGMLGGRLRAAPRSAGAVLRWAGSPAGVLVLFCGATAAGLLAFGMTNPLFDRYLWPVVPPLAILLMYVAPAPASQPESAPTWRSAGRGAVVAASLMVAALGSLSLAYAANANAFDAALWRGGQALVAAGVPPDEVDAGYAWLGAHATTPLIGGGTHRVRYRQLWPEFRQCGSVTSDPRPEAGTLPVGTEAYPLFLIGGPIQPLFLYRDSAPECGTD